MLQPFRTSPSTMREIIRMLLSDGVFFLQDFPISRDSRFLFRIGLFREYYSIRGWFLKFFSAVFSFFSGSPDRSGRIGKWSGLSQDRIQIFREVVRKHPGRRENAGHGKVEKIMIKICRMPGLERLCVKNPLFCRIVPVKECGPLLTDSRF